MDYSFFESIYTDYGIHTIISAILICFLRLIFKKFFSQKFNSITRAYFEMLFAFFIEAVYTLIFFGSLNAFGIKSISSALLSYSASLIIYSIMSRIISGKHITKDSRSLLIESLIEDYVIEEKKTSLANEILIVITNEELDKQQICSIIIENQKRPFDEEEITALVDIIIDSISAMQ